MKLRKRREERPPVEIRARLSAETHDDLLAYASLYAETYERTIDPKELLEDIVIQFLSSDRTFRRWKNDRPNLTTNGVAKGGLEASA